MSIEHWTVHVIVDCLLPIVGGGGGGCVKLGPVEPHYLRAKHAVETIYLNDQYKY